MAYLVNMNKQGYTVKQNKAKERFVVLADGTQIPADIAGLAAGEDVWLSEIVCKCRDCKQPFTLRELHGCGQWCESCQDASVND